MEAKKQLLKDTFESAFDMSSYERFIKEFFNAVEIVAPYNKKKNTWTEFSFNITSYSYVANYTDNERNRIAILAVELKTGKNVERARSAQRNFVSKLITNSGHDAAIVAFYPENNSKSTDENASKWRLSFVKLDQEWLGEGKVKTTITPAKRYSYLVGEKEPCHTAQEQLFPIFKDENYKPTLAKIEEAFSVEAVTDEFFKEYKEKYHELREHLEKSEEFLEAAEKHEFTSEQFAKKLMGQLAFLYFIQKKGWLGVKVVKKSLTEKEYRDAFYQSKYSKIVIPKAYEQKELDLYKLKASALTGDYLTDDEADRLASCFKTEAWGSGTKSFIRDLFNSCIKSGKNFFEDFLEPLFYEALSIKRGDHHYYKRFNCKIPFLNGGLFDPIENYDWKYTTFDIPNCMFSNKDEKGEIDCNGILDMFERYNFTMNEDEPLEREVAVDPEMLGKIFENLLDSDDRKSKGAFYTPREIVHYMCQESLINYLMNETTIPYEDLKQFILYGEIMKDEDCANTMNLKNDDIRRLPKTVFDNLRGIDTALENVKIADPAVGSGAFPLGMLSEIVKARENITAYVAAQIINQDKNIQKSQRAAYYESREPYKIKWKTIKNSIYGVDIEASAVDIAKLRLWLSLIVDEDLTPSYNDICCGITTQIDPKPLPNLDYNIMCGNSLIDQFDGIKLFDDSLFDKDESVDKKQSDNMQITLFQDQMELQIEKLFNEQDRLFGENNTENKKYLKKEIDKTIDRIIRSKLTNDGNAVGLEKYEDSLKQKTKPYFLWKLEFAKIFKEKGGFDIVIGNPPYGAKLSAIETKAIKEKLVYTVNTNTAAVFIDYAISKWLKTNGILSYIVPKSLLYSERWLSLAKKLAQKTSVLVDVEKAFEKVKLEQVVFVYNDFAEQKQYYARKFLNNEFIRNNYIPVELLTKLNAWICDVETRELEIINNLHCEYIKMADISITKRGIGVQKDIKTSGEYEVIGGKNIRRFKIDGFKGYLSKDVVEGKSKKFEFMAQPKIITQDLVAHVQNPKPHILITSTFDEKGVIIGLDTVQNTVLLTDEYNYKYILGLLNSNFVSWYAYKFIYCSAIRTMHFDNNYIGRIIIPKASKQQQQEIIDCVDVLMSIDLDIDKLEWNEKKCGLDDLVYKLYGLEKGEMEYIEYCTNGNKIPTITK